jgi:hypothetical protein
MRDSLRKSLADSPVKNFERYPKGSIVLCHACSDPIYKLEAGIGVGQKAGRSVSLFKPLALTDLADLAERPDIDAGVRARIASWTPDERRAHVAKLTTPKAGDAMICPVCRGCFVQVLTVEKTETIDRAYVLELHTIPPYGLARPAPIRGKRFYGDSGDWLH